MKLDYSYSDEYLKMYYKMEKIMKQNNINII